jgi:small conductance mechanosensitive channel
MTQVLALLQESAPAARPAPSRLDRIQADPAGVGTEVGLPLLAAAAIFVVGRWVARALRGALGRMLTGRGVDRTLTGFLGSIAYALTMTMVVIAAVGQLGVATTSFVAVLGAAGLAVGLALQGTLGNFASGVMIILFRPFKAGDRIEAGGTAGTVLNVKIFVTELKTGDNRLVIVPNGTIMGGNITNFSAHETRRVDMVFGCGYGDDVRQVKKALEEILAGDERVLKDPRPVVAVSQLGDSSINFIVRPWVKTSDYWPVLWDTHEKVKLHFDEKGIEIPFPQRDVHLYQAS